MERPRRVVGLGLCAFDRLFVVDALSLAAERVRYRERADGPGGMIGTALAQAAQLGCRAHVLSVVGEDAEGRAVERGLRRLGVSTRRLVRSAAHPTPVALVLVERGTGERRFVVPDRRAAEREAPELDLAPIDARSVLLVDGHFPRQALRAVRRARATGAPVVADLSDARPAHLRLLPHVTHAIVPESFVASWGAGGVEATLRELRARYGCAPVVTRGARGALALRDGRLHRVPARRVRVRDTTGAGDVYHGAFAAGLARGLDVLEALALASRAAALACTALGGTTRLMTQDEI